MSLNSVSDADNSTASGLWVNARLATLSSGMGIVEAGAVAVREGRIVFCGPQKELPVELQASLTPIDCAGRWITPALIDCHTHLVFGGDRAGEFEMRLAGATYEEIARAGGGILSTMKATRAATEAELIAAALPRLDALIAEGVTTLEVKSGYGLSLDDELKLLRAARALGRARDVQVTTTLLGAHALPPEFAADRAGYLHQVCEEMIPAAAAEGLADAVD